MKIRPVAAELFNADRRTDMTKLIFAFRKFVNAPNNATQREYWELLSMIMSYELQTSHRVRILNIWFNNAELQLPGSFFKPLSSPSSREPNCEERLLASSCLSVRLSVRLSLRPSTRNNSALTRRILKKFNIWVFFENLSIMFRLHYDLTGTSGTLQEHPVLYRNIRYFTGTPKHISDHYSPEWFRKKLHRKYKHIF